MFVWNLKYILLILVYSTHVIVASTISICWLDILFEQNTYKFLFFSFCSVICMHAVYVVFFMWCSKTTILISSYFLDSKMIIFLLQKWWFPRKLGWFFLAVVPISWCIGYVLHCSVYGRFCLRSELICREHYFISNMSTAFGKFLAILVGDDDYSWFQSFFFCTILCSWKPRFWQFKGLKCYTSTYGYWSCA